MISGGSVMLDSNTAPDWPNGGVYLNIMCWNDAGCDVNFDLLVMLAGSCSDWSSVRPPLSSSLRRAISASWHMTFITSSTLRNMEKSLCFCRVWTRITSVSRPTDTRSRRVTSAQGTNSFTNHNKWHHEGFECCWIIDYEGIELLDKQKHTDMSHCWE